MKKHFQTLDIYKPNKQILYDIDHNKYFLKYENDTKLYNSNLFGIKTPKEYCSNIILSSYKDRILSHSMDKINFKVDNSLYRPQSNRFEGYTQFARPLVVPFTNISQPQTRKYLYETISKLKNDFVIEKNKNIFDKKLNKGLHYYTGTISNISDIKGKNLFLKKINECLKQEEDAKNMDKAQSMDEREIKSLINIKKKLMSNSTNLIFGRKLKPPNTKFIQQFKINYNIYFRNPIEKLKTLKTEKKDYFKDLYQALNKDEVKEYLSSINPKTTLNNNMFNILKSKKKNYRYLFGTYNSENLTQTKTTKETNVFDDKDNSSSLEQTKCLFENNDSTNKDYLDILNSKRDNIFDSMENNASKNYKHLFSKDYEQKKQFSSFDNKDMVSGDKIDIRTLSIINKNYKLEKKLLKDILRKK